ncbi:MAG: SDR family NAD(P)-dependent oxidoreductase [Methylocella sp.]
MEGKTCVITGATSGIGLTTAERLATIGARLVLIGRDLVKGEAALKQIRAKTPNIDASFFYADLSRLGEVRRVASDILTAAPRIDVLISNAGAIFDRRETTEDGLERTFAVNYLSHFLLAALRLDRLNASAPARIVTVTSRAHLVANADFGDLQNQGVASGSAACQRAKLCCILFTRKLGKRVAGTGVRAYSIHPGPAATSLGDDLGGALGAWLSFAKQSMSMPPETAAAGTAYVASSPAITGATGKYFDQCQLTSPSPAAEGDVAAERLWLRKRTFGRRTDVARDPAKSSSTRKLAR